jgi:hypothetical protein
VADAMEAFRENVNEKAADELAGVERHRGVTRRPRDAIIFDFERHTCRVGLDETAVRDGDALWSTGSPLGSLLPFRGRNVRSATRQNAAGALRLTQIRIVHVSGVLR